MRLRLDVRALVVVLVVTVAGLIWGGRPADAVDGDPAGPREIWAAAGGRHDR